MNSPTAKVSIEKLNLIEISKDLNITKLQNKIRNKICKV